MHTLSYALSLLSFCLEEGDEAWYIVATESKAACPEEEYVWSLPGLPVRPDHPSLPTRVQLPRVPVPLNVQRN